MREGNKEKMLDALV